MSVIKGKGREWLGNKIDVSISKRTGHRAGCTSAHLRGQK